MQLEANATLLILSGPWVQLPELPNTLNDPVPASLIGSAAADAVVAPDMLDRMMTSCPSAPDGVREARVVSRSVMVLTFAPCDAVL